MKSSTPVRRRSVATLLAAAAMIAAFILPAAASASHTAAMAPVELLTPGCQAKGQLALAAGNAGALATGRYAYAVTGIVGTTETNPCGASPVAVNNGGGPTNTSQALILWDAVPGAVDYRIYRAPLDPTTGQPTAPFQALVFGAGPDLTLSPTQVCPPGGTGTGSRCAFQDSGGPSAPGANPPAFVAGWNGTERHPDIRMTQCVDYGDPALPACPNPAPQATDDPFTGDTGETAPALKADVLHFPPGVTPMPSVGHDVQARAPAPSLLGDLNKFGSQRPGRGHLPGVVTGRQRADAQPCRHGPHAHRRQHLRRRGEGRRARAPVHRAAPGLLRAGHPVAPGRATYYRRARRLQPRGREGVHRVGVVVREALGLGSYGIDAATVKAETDGPLGAVPQRAGRPGHRERRAAKTPVQVRQLTQYLPGLRRPGNVRHGSTTSRSSTSPARAGTRGSAWARRPGSTTRSRRRAGRSTWASRTATGCRSARRCPESSPGDTASRAGSRRWTSP